ncbi:MAG: hypothetical protein ACQXXJ_06965 [Candidatus Bathyarchaeia archaeon]|jgi:hypothetical protein
MSSEECVVTIQNTLSEIRNICPQILTAFVFKPDKTVLATAKDTDKIDVASTVDALCMLIRHARVGGDLESFSVDSVEQRAVVTRLYGVYFAMVYSRTADEKVIASLSRGIVPIVLRLVELVQPELMHVSPCVFEGFSSEKTQVAFEGAEAEHPSVLEEVVGSEKHCSVRSSFLDSVVSQLTVENLNGIRRLIGSQDNVRVDPSVIDRWVALCGQKEITHVEVEETQTGKKIVCRFKPIKDAAFSGRAVIQLPEKIQAELQTQRGAQVLVRPIIK